MKKLNLLKTTLLLGFVTVANPLLASDCINDLGRLIATNTSEMGILDPIVIAPKYKRVGQYTSSNENGYFKSLYEVEISKFNPLPMIRYSESAHNELIDYISNFGVPLERAAKIAIMPDNSLKILDGGSFIRVLYDLGEETFPAEIVVWSQLKSEQKHLLKDAILSEPEYEIVQRYGDELAEVLGKYQTRTTLSKQEQVLLQEYEQKLEHSIAIKEYVRKTLNQEPLNPGIDYEQSFAPTEWEILRAKQKVNNQASANVQVKRSASETPLHYQKLARESTSIERDSDNFASESKISPQEREEFMSYYKEYHEKQRAISEQQNANNEKAVIESEEVTAQRRIINEQEARISHLNNDSALIGLFVKIEVLTKKYPEPMTIDDLTYYTQDKQLQAAVHNAMIKLNSSSQMHAQELLTEYIILLRKSVLANEAIMLRIASEDLDEVAQNKKISLATIKTFNGHIERILSSAE